MKIPYNESLIRFDERVLTQGTPRKDKTYSLEELRNLLFFNNVFVSNTDEIFEKNKPLGDLGLFHQCSLKYIHNISEIKQKIFAICKDMNEIDEFSPDVKREVANRLRKSVSIKKNIEYNSGQLYFISASVKGVISIKPDNEIFKSPILTKRRHGIYYCPTVIAIQKYLNEVMKVSDITAVRLNVLDGYGGVITKIEYFGPYKPSTDAVVVYNPYLYTDDLIQLVNMNCPASNKIEIQSKMKYNLHDVLSHDILIEYPIDSFLEFLAFLKKAIVEWNTKKIFLTLYRIGDDPTIFNILHLAVMKGIKVHVNVELKASGETINEHWASELRRIGVYVTTYKCGVLKVHAKAALIELDGGISIAQIGTGNYHTKTTLQYTDLSLITSNRNICDEVRKLFAILDDDQEVFNNNFLVTRNNFNKEFIKLIRRESDKGEDGLIIVKCNSLDDDHIIEELKRASDKGCSIYLIIRGVCTWNPRRDNVIVKSIVWDKLEHSRVYSFGYANPTIYIGSLDLVTNKIQKRIETLVRIDDPDITVKICNYLNRYITTVENSWIMQQDGSYTKE